MKPKCIGIVGGAGPLAGAYLLERLFTLSGEVYGCYRDADFPKVILISFPFSEMLCPDVDVPKIKRELKECLQQLRQNGALVLAIACNTLHAFLDQEDELNDLIHLPRILAEKMPTENPLIFCTSTSAKFGLHKRFFPCTYPSVQTQQEVDRIIDQILKGSKANLELELLIQSQSAKTIVLGCTELSLLSSQLSVPNKVVIDPLELMANKILQTSF